MRSFFSLFKIVMEGRASKRFFIGAILSFSFSITVILSTVGLMDGFEFSLKEGLRNASGDLVLFNGDSFFNAEKMGEILPPELKQTYLVEVSAFALFNDESKGVLLKGIEPDSFGQVTGLKLKINKSQVAIGSELSKSLGIQPGDEIILAISGSSNLDIKTSALMPFTVSEIVKHGIFEKDMRFIYVHDSDLREVLNLKDSSVNRLLMKVREDEKNNLEKISDKLNKDLPPGYVVEPFWAEFSTLLKAVGVEKFSITLILQIIVVVALFNVVSFIFYIGEKKSQDFFLLRAIGLSNNSLIKFWFGIIFLIWFFSCSFSYLLTALFDLLLLKLPLFKIPGNIYVLSELSLKLSLSEYFLVFGISFFWIFLICLISILRLRKISILSGLRQEFK